MGQMATLASPLMESLLSLWVEAIFLRALSLLNKKKAKGLVAQSCLTLCHPVDCTLPGFSVHGILQARILEWVAISFFRGSHRPKDKPGSPALQADYLPSYPPGKLKRKPNIM